jgi:folate-binding protein YgfZ
MSMRSAIDLSAGPQGLGVLAMRGPDAAGFLQGQLSADIEKLSAGASTLAGLHNPQGRVIALLALVRSAPEEFFAVLPRELAPAVAQRLRKYVLRAKVTLEDLSESVQVFGSAAPAPGFIDLAWGTRRLLLVPRERAVELTPGSGQTLESWQQADIHEGLPQVYAATSEAFVAQMLNLDLLGAIDFDKGCYTGQEVIARAHYRGRVKRRLQRWRQTDRASLKPGDAVRSMDGKTLAVVRVAEDETNGVDLLAVGAFAAAEVAATAESTAAPEAGAARVTGPLPLPYSLPQ